MKTAAIMVAVAMALVGFAPAASADDGNGLSRTFLSWGSIEWKPHSQDPGGDWIGGAGFYHPDDRSGLCLTRLFGVGLQAGFYYEGIPKPRSTFSDPNIHVAEFSEAGVFLNCPPPLADATTPQPQWLGTSAGNVYLGPQVGQSNIRCFKSFDICLGTPGTEQWFLYDCNGYDGTGVSGSKKNDNEVVFGQGNLIGHNFGPPFPDIGSSHVWDGCTKDGPGLDGSGPDPGVKAYDASPYLHPHLDNQASLPDVHLDQLNINDPDQATTYVVSCFRETLTKFPSNPVPHTDTSHDYFLLLGVGDEDNWVPALLYHEGAPTGPFGKKTVSPSFAEQGLYDLSGQNGCPSDMLAVDKVLCPHFSYRPPPGPAGSIPCPSGADDEKKPKDNPLVSI